jgi:hypothetical protein
VLRSRGEIQNLVGQWSSVHEVIVWKAGKKYLQIGKQLLSRSITGPRHGRFTNASGEMYGLVELPASDNPLLILPDCVQQTYAGLQDLEN